jgi:hypothetical protein
MTPLLSDLVTLWNAMPPPVPVFLAGVVTGWMAARRVTRYMLGGRP